MCINQFNTDKMLINPAMKSGSSETDPRHPTNDERNGHVCREAMIRVSNQKIGTYAIGR